MKNAKWIEAIERHRRRPPGLLAASGLERHGAVHDALALRRARAGDRLTAGQPLLLGGIAFAGDRGITRVEVGRRHARRRHALLWMDADLAAGDRRGGVAALDLSVHAHRGPPSPQRARDRRRRRHPAAGTARQLPQRRARLARRGRRGRLSASRACHLRRGVGGVRVHVPAQVAQDPSPPADRAPGETSFLVQNLTRAELWRFFEPPPERRPPHPDYAFIGNRSTLGARYDGRRWSVRGAVQYVRLENLPRGAIGPGLLGTGAAYFFQAGGTFSYQFYLRGLSAQPVARRHAAVGSRPAGCRARRIRASRVRRRRRIDRWRAARLERAAARRHGVVALPARLGRRARRRRARRRGGDRRRRSLPTQGTFEESANLPIDRVRVAAAEVSAAPGALVAAHAVPRLRARLRRHAARSRARPDNTGRARPRAADVPIGTVGGRRRWRLSRRDRARGTSLVWVGRRRSATGTDSRIGRWSSAAEGGYHWTARAGAAVAARRRGLRVGRRRRRRRPARHVLPAAAVGRPVRRGRTPTRS